MSIAVSAVVKPSRVLLLIVGGACACVVAIGLAISFGTLGNLSFSMQLAIGLPCIFFAFFGAYRALRIRKTHHIDISGNGRIRLAETTPLAALTSSLFSHDTDMNGDQARLLPSSTVWPFLLLLNLQTEGGRVINIPILPDSIDRDTFRAFSVACRWIAAHREPTQHANFSDLWKR
jgi:hypothetical protein